jgi:hypothetical protein
MGLWVKGEKGLNSCWEEEGLERRKGRWMVGVKTVKRKSVAFRP